MLEFLKWSCNGLGSILDRLLRDVALLKVRDILVDKVSADCAILSDKWDEHILLESNLYFVGAEL